MKMIFEEKETLKNMNNKYKTQFDELKEKVFNCQEMNHRLSEHVKTLDSRNSNSKYKISAMKKTVTDKQTEINNLRDELYAVDAFRKQKNDRDEILNDYLDVKEELDNKTKKLREVEQLNTEYKLKSDELFIENQLNKKNSFSQAHYIELLNANIKTIRSLKDQNRNLKKELWEYVQKPENDPNESENDRSFLVNFEKLNEIERSDEKNMLKGKMIKIY